MVIYLVLIVLLLSCPCIDSQTRNSAICFLTSIPAFDTIKFAEELAQDAIQYNLDVFIMVDDNKFNISAIHTSSNLRLLQIDNNECLQHGYQKTISLYNNWRIITSWDKALLYFGLFHKNYSFVWLIEEDVFVPSTKAFLSIHQLYSDTSDLIIPHNQLNLIGDTSKWHWSMAITKFIPPWSCSMVNVVGFSRRMLVAIDNYIQWLGEVPFHEFFFNTLAMQLNLTIVVPAELNTVVYGNYHSPIKILKQPNNLWHPSKNPSQHRVMRIKLINNTLNDTNTDNFISDLTNRKLTCQNTSTIPNIEQHLTRLLTKFEIKKSEFSPNMRLIIRKRFLDLAEDCRKRNISKTIITLTIQLADQAYQLPEPPVQELIKNKSAQHLKLELALKENKEIIFRLPLRSPLLNEFREQRKHLTKELTYEIKREIRNRTNPSSSFLSTTITRTVTSSALLFISRNTNTNMADRLDILIRKNSYRILNSMGNNRKILSVLLLVVFSLLFAFFQWQKVRNQKYYVMIFILSILLFCWYVMI